MWSARCLLRGCRRGKYRQQQGTGEQNAHSGFSAYGQRVSSSALNEASWRRRARSRRFCFRVRQRQPGTAGRARGKSRCSAGPA
jgi:hypothetical protein